MEGDPELDERRHPDTADGRRAARLEQPPYRCRSESSESEHPSEERQSEPAYVATDECGAYPKPKPSCVWPPGFRWDQGVRKALDTLNILRHVMRAILSDRPKCSHRGVSLKKVPTKPVQVLKHTSQNSTEQTSMRMKWFKQIAI